ncbi:MAG: TRAP transporter substrate-binding protein DctP, partial [Pseudorhodobacter sp.]
ANAEKLVVSTNLAPQHWGTTKGAEPFMSCVTEATNGEIEFDYFHSGQLASFFESLNAVNDGLAQMALIVLPAQSDKLPLTGITQLAGLGTTTVQSTEATRTVLEEEGPIRDEYTRNNIIPLMINVYPSYQMLSRGAPIDSLAAMQNVPISSGGGALLVTLAELGAAPVESATGDVYLSMQQGTVDATMLSTVSIMPYNLHEVIKSVSANGNFGIATGIWSIDSGAWEQLTEPQRVAMKDCGLQTEQTLAAWVDELVTQTQGELSDMGIEVYNFPEEELAKIDDRLSAARENYVARLAARNLPAEAAYQDYLEALDR